MSIATVVTEGFGSFGDVAHVVTQGFDIGAAAVINADATILTQAFGKQTAASAFVVTEGFQAGAAVVPPTGQVQQSSGGSGRRFGTSNLDLKYWGRKKRKLEEELKALEKRLEAKREEVNKAPTLEKVQALKKQLAELQKLLLELLAEIDMARKEYELEEEKEVIAVYLAYKKRFH